MPAISAMFFPKISFVKTIISIQVNYVLYIYPKVWRNFQYVFRINQIFGKLDLNLVFIILTHVVGMHIYRTTTTTLSYYTPPFFYFDFKLLSHSHTKSYKIKGKYVTNLFYVTRSFKWKFVSKIKPSQICFNLNM